MALDDVKLEPRRLADPADGLPTEVWFEPVAESPLHLAVLLYLVAALRWHLRDRDDACVEGNIALQFDRDDLRRHVAPDVLVALGVAKVRPGKSYALWVEGKAPDLVFEVTSESTHREDTGPKLQRYFELGVREVVLFDPEDTYLSPPLRLYRRGSAGFERVPGDGERASLETLELDVVRLGQEVRLLDRRSGELLRSAAEESQAREDAELARESAEQARANAEQARANAERRVAELEAELRRLRGE
ncbi:MAG: Uma2 family endonuclease [Planctomycetota bacterium]